jgi:hypothetical protein
VVVDVDVDVVLDGDLDLNVVSIVDPPSFEASTADR